jgi:hypothetical protein
MSGLSFALVYSDNQTQNSDVPIFDEYAVIYV